MNPLNRRHMLKGGIAMGVSAATFGPATPRAARAQSPEAVASPVTGGTASTRARLDAATIPKYEDPLLIPPAMPTASADSVPAGVSDGEDYYEIALNQFRQAMLPASLGLSTTVWGYTVPGQAETMHSPSFTIEAEVGRPVRVKWINNLVDDQGNFLPHLLPIDPTLHWANPGGGEEHRDDETMHATGEMAEPYTGPVPMVVHLHGGSTHEESDGYTTAWFLPDAANIPDGYATVGSMYEEFAATFEENFGQAWEPGTSVTHYANDQAASTLWFHDHVLGITRLNVYTGPAGFYLLRGGDLDVPAGVLPGPAPQRGDAPDTRHYDIPLAIQDRSFYDDGELFYPDSRAFFDGFEGPYTPESDMAPIWNPEFFGETMIVNGHTWPTLTVEPRRYRFRVLNGCNSRFLILKLADDPLASRPAPAALQFHQVGSDSGYLPAPVSLDALLLAPAERADIVVDFTGLAEGTECFLINEAPDEPFGGGVPGTDFEPANPETTGQVMRFVIGPLLGEDTSLPIERVELPEPPALGPSGITRRLALIELDSEVLPDVGPREAVLGIVSDDGEAIPLDVDDPITETIVANAIEVWEFHNFTADAHPIHVHEVQFEVVDRQVFDGEPRPPEAWETGRKDTVIAYPGEITRVKVQFVHEGLFVWHCHILEHEDNEMMRPLRVIS